MLTPVFNPALYGTPLPVHGTVNLLDVVYLYSSSPNTVAEAEANADGTMPAVGVVVYVDPVTGTVELANSGVVSGFVGLTPNAVYYVSGTTPGGITSTPPSSRVQPIGLALSATQLQLFPAAFGVGGFGPLAKQGDGQHNGLVVDSLNNVVAGLGALATTATDGFLYVETCAGTPTGVPRTQTGSVPVIVDTTALKIWVYTGGAWHYAALT